MEFIRTIRAKHQASVDASIQKQAEDFIRVEDFAGSLFIGFNGTPLVDIQEDWTVADVLKKLDAVRENYIHYRKEEEAPARTPASKH